MITTDHTHVFPRLLDEDVARDRYRPVDGEVHSSNRIGGGNEIHYQSRSWSTSVESTLVRRGEPFRSLTRACGAVVEKMLQSWHEGPLEQNRCLTPFLDR